MFPAETLSFARAAALADLAGSLLLAGAAARALVQLLRGDGTERARLTLAEGAVWALSIKTAGTLLKTIELQTWDQLATFTAILALRILLKRLFAWEGVRLRTLAQHQCLIER